MIDAAVLLELLAGQPVIIYKQGGIFTGQNDNINAIINITSDHSERQSAITIDKLVGFAKTNGVSHIIVSDYNTLSGTADLVTKCKQNNIKASVGLRIQLKFDERIGYVTLIAKNHSGYVAICKVLRDGYLNQHNGLPVIDLDILRKYCGDETDGFDNIILTTGGMEGLLFSMISNQDSSVSTLMKSFIDIFERKNVFVEVQFHGFVNEQQCFPQMATLAETIGVGLLATNDPRFVTCSDDEITAYQILKYAHSKSVEPITDADKEYYIKTPEKLREALSCILFDDQVDIAIDNINVLAYSCDLQFPEINHYPKFCSPDGRASEEVLRETVRKNIPTRYKQWKEQHETRLRHELDIIISMGFADYMLIVADYVGFAKSAGKERFQNEHAVVVGPGRGSAVGSLVCYLLGITDVDPISQGLLFERFLNPARTAMPDIDVDFARCIKDEVVDYVREKYGNSSVGKLSVNVLFSLKESIIITAKYLSAINQDQDYFFIGDKMIDYLKRFDKDNNVSKEEHDNKLLSIVQEIDKEKGTQIINSATLITNIISHKSVHSAGVIISDVDLTDCVPIKMGENCGMIAECDKNEAEAFYHLIKMNFLTNKSLDFIAYVISAARL